MIVMLCSRLSQELGVQYQHFHFTFAVEVFAPFLPNCWLS
uniref:Uncharacterized protein n=1 Tax=Anguilla anguilla TaxID=7936 RepID=A0A0E9W8B3_ANGAN